MCDPRVVGERAFLWGQGLGVGVERAGSGFVNRASGAGGYKWFVRGVMQFVPGGGRTRD